MSNWWELEDDEEVTGSYSSGGGDFDPIPNNTRALAEVNSVMWAERGGERYVNIQWEVVKPAAYANRRVFQKIYVVNGKPGAKNPKDAQKKARDMWRNIDHNAGGKLVRLGREPNDDDMTLALQGKQMIIDIMLWEIDGNKGNWVGAVHPKGSKEVVEVSKPEPTKRPVADDLDEEIPF